MPKEGPGTPHISLNITIPEINPAGVNKIKQLGVSHVHLLGGPISELSYPWDASKLSTIVKSLKDAGLTLAICELPGQHLTNIILGRSGRDKEIEDVKACLRAAGQAGVPVVQYSLYVHRLSEGYFTAPDPQRGNAMLRSFDYDSAKDLPPLPEIGVHTHEELWASCEYFIKAVIPTAEAAHVRMAQHPNDGPGPITRGSHQIMSTLEDWKRLVAIVDSPSNGIVYDCGIARELGEDPVAVARYFGERDRINHVHYRNVIMRTPREFYTETYPDMGDNNMLAVMKELVRLKYNRSIFPEHARGLDVDRDTKDDDYAAWALQVGYTRAMMQVALMQQ